MHFILRPPLSPSLLPLSRPSPAEEARRGMQASRRNVCIVDPVLRALYGCLTARSIFAAHSSFKETRRCSCAVWKLHWCSCQACRPTHACRNVALVSMLVQYCTVQLALRRTNRSAVMSVLPLVSTYRCSLRICQTGERGMLMLCPGWLSHSGAG